MNILTATASPERFLKLQGEVFPSQTRRAHLEVFRQEWPRCTMGIPEVCHALHNFNLLSSLVSNRVEDETVFVCITRKEKLMSDSEWCIVCACDHHTLLCAPWHRFPLCDQLLCCNTSWRVQTLLNTHALSPSSVTKASLPLQCLNLPVSTNIWFLWCSWLHQHSCAPFSVFFNCGCPLSETQA